MPARGGSGKGAPTRKERVEATTTGFLKSSAESGGGRVFDIPAIIASLEPEKRSKATLCAVEG